MRVASIQIEISNCSKEAALRHVLSLLNQARGCDLVLLPELWPSGYYAFDRYATDSEPVNGPLVQALREKACNLRAHLFTGSFVERDGSKLFNTSLLLNPDGEILAKYRKIHLFGYHSMESQLLGRGNDVVVVPTRWGRMGFAICYDLRFPELFRRMLDQGAEFFLVTSAWPKPREEAWVLLNRARAVENMAYLMSCNCAGEVGGKQYVGRSMIVDPMGVVLAEGGSGEEIVTAEIDPGRVAEVRRELPFIADRVFGPDPHAT